MTKRHRLKPLQIRFDILLDKRVMAEWDPTAANLFPHKCQGIGSNRREAIRDLVTITQEHNGCQITLVDGIMQT